MKSMKFYIYVSNIAVLMFAVIFMIYGYIHEIYVLMGLGILLAIYEIFRLYRMIKAFKDQEIK